MHQKKLQVASFTAHFKCVFYLDYKMYTQNILSKMFFSCCLYRLSGWFLLAKVRFYWHAPVKTVITLQIPQKAGNYFTS
jgi:hypothetical protein